MKKFLFLTLCCALSLSVVAQGTRPVRGIVFDSDGIPMSGVTLTAVGSTDSKLSGADGTFEMMVSPYTKLIEASKEGFISARAEVDGSYLVFKLQVDKKYAENKAKAEEEARLAAQKAAEAEQARIAAEKAAAEKAEQERLAAEEKKRIEEEKRIAAEKAAAEKAERERLAAEEKKRIEEEKRIAAEKAAAEKAERERLAAEEKKRIEEEKRIAAEKAAAEKAERERLAAEEKKRLEEEKRIAAEKAAAEKAERERIAAEERKRIEEEKRIAAEKAAAEKAERERLAAEEKKRIEEEKRIAAEKAAAEKAERQRIAAEEKSKQSAVKASKEDDSSRLAKQEEAKAKKQENIAKWKEAKLRGYGSIIDAAWAIDLSNLMMGGGVNYIGGYHFNNCIYLGLGTGVNLTQTWERRFIDEVDLSSNLINIPVYAYLRTNFIDRRCSPFFAISAGYSFSTKRNFTMPFNQHVKYRTSGILINPQLGVNFRTTKKSSVYLAVGATLKQHPLLVEHDATTATFSSNFHYWVDIHLGFTF